MKITEEMVEAGARALLQDSTATDSDYWYRVDDEARAFYTEQARVTVEAALGASPGRPMLMDKVQKVVAAWSAPGLDPRLHLNEKERLRERWPALATAVGELARGSGWEFSVDYAGRTVRRKVSEWEVVK